MLISKVDPLLDALELLLEVSRMPGEAKYGPAVWACHCQAPQGQLELCIWHRIEIFLQMTEPRCTCLPAGPAHDHSDDCSLEQWRKSRLEAGRGR